MDENVKSVLKEVVEALLNVPMVGEVYDQQHSDTHLRAYLLIKELLEKYP